MKSASNIFDPRAFDRYTKVGGPVPKTGPVSEGFWAGGEVNNRMGIAGSAQRRAYMAGRERAKVERGLIEHM